MKKRADEMLAALPRCPARLMSFAKTWEAFKSGTKTVTRRSRLRWKCDGCGWEYDRAGNYCCECGALKMRKRWLPGWPSLKVGDYIEGAEWSPRVGKRWVCEECGWPGPTCKDPRHSRFTHNSCAGGRLGHYLDFEYRGPERLPGLDGYRRVVSVREERLGAITPEDVEREGFPGKSPEWFIEMYCAPGKPDPGRPVTRIEYEAVGP